VTRRSLLVPGLLFVAVAAFLAERWIRTDREQVVDLLEGASKAAERGDWDAVRDAVDEDFEGMPRDRFVAAARRLASLGIARGWRLVVERVEVDGDRATARVDVRLPSLARQVAPPTTGEVGLVRTAAGWRVRSVSPDAPGVLR
jgi:hypothetical protein